MEYGSCGNVVFMGKLEKRRDGAVRGGWAMRTFLLTRKSIHYFRRLTETDLLGEERGHINLQEIVSVRALSENLVPEMYIEPGNTYHYLEIVMKSKTIMMRTSISDADACSHWTEAITSQKKRLDEALRGDEVTTPMSPVRSSSMPAELLTYEPTISEEEAPKIAIVSTVGSSTDEDQHEIVVGKGIKWGETIDIGVLPEGGFCIISLNGGETARVGTQALMGSWDAEHPCWVDVIDSDKGEEIQVSAQCDMPERKQTVNSPKHQRMAVQSDHEASEFQSKFMSSLHTLKDGSSIGFLLTCLLVHVLYGVDGFHWIVKICLTVGAALAISTIMKSSSSNGESSRQQDESVESINVLPRLRFHITFHRYRVRVDGHEVSYPRLE